MKTCPFINGPCIEHQCVMYTMVMGLNPNTGQEVNEWNCAVAWLPVLLVENSQQQRQTGAAVESFRNEMVKQNHVLAQGMVGIINKQLGGPNAKAAHQ